MITFLYVLLAIVILLLMIMIHEFGHYIVGKALKFKINEFSIGFGPKLFSKQNKKTGEVFSLRAIPLGGFCAFEDESGLDDKKSDESNKSFVSEAPWKRILVLLAGAGFNFISAIIFAFIFILVVGVQVPAVNEVYKDNNGNFFNSQIMAQDKIIAINGHEINILHNYQDYIAKINSNEDVRFTVVRNGETLDIMVKKQHIETVIDGKLHNYEGFGFSSLTTFNKATISDAFIYCVPYTVKLSWSILGTFGKLITGKIPITNLTGPVGTVGTMAQVSQANWRNILMLLPLIASNLAIFNILPIPSLDGSKIVFTVIEWVRGKPVNRNVENYIHAIGLLLLFVFIIVVDLIGFFAR